MWGDTLTSIMSPPFFYYNEGYNVTYMWGDTITSNIGPSLFYYNKGYNI